MTAWGRRIVYMAVALDLALWSTVSWVIVAIHVIGITYLRIVPRLLPPDDKPQHTEQPAIGETNVT